VWALLPSLGWNRSYAGLSLGLSFYREVDLPAWRRSSFRRNEHQSRDCSNTTKGGSSLVQIEQRGDITLVVRDQSGAVIPKASVSLVSEVNHQKQERTTDSTGQLRFSALNLGSYVLTVGTFAFEAERKVISLSQGQTVNIEVTLKIAALMGDVVSYETAVPKLQPLPEFIDQIDLGIQA
jgi:Carboxypeptidase regulatory-like domain